MSQFFGGIDRTPPRNLGAEMTQSRRQGEDLLAANLKGDVKSANAEMGVMGDFFQSVMAKYPELARREREATTMQRGQDVQDFGNFSPKLEAYFNKINPGWKEAGGTLTALLKGAGDRSPLLGKLNTDAMGDGMSPINQRLMGLAMGELDKGGALSPDEQRQIQQNARGMASARGLYGSDMAGIDEIMNLDAAQRQRLYDRAGFAGGIERGLEAEQTADRGFATSVEGLNQGADANARSTVLGASSALQDRFSPFMPMLTARSATNPVMAAGVFQSAPNTIGSSRATMADALGYGSDLFNTNFNADWSKQVMETNNAVALHKSMDEAISTMVGGAMGKACWVARAVYGEQNPAWLRVRHWLLTRAPLWFAAFYLTRGAQWAERIARQAEERDQIRSVFNTII